jgi:hypothetical protein
VRPVNRGDRGTYPWRISVTPYSQLEGDLRGKTMNFQGVAAIRKAFNRYEPSLWNLLRRMNEIVGYVGMSGGATPEGRMLAAKGAATTKLDTEYQQATAPLKTNLGAFCSYCEQRVPKLAVEHMSPKANYPFFYLCWGNFLLACERCNGNGSGKGSGPAPGQVEGFPGFPAANRNATDYWEAIHTHYLWPDQPNSYRALMTRLEYDAANRAPATGNPPSWTPLADADAAKAARTANDDGAKTVSASFAIGGTPAITAPVRAWLYAPNNDAAAVAAIGYFGFDKPSTGANAEGETRVYNRTLAWFAAKEAIGLVKSLIAHGALQTDIDQAWSSVRNGAKSAGYFSVYVRVLDLLDGRNINYPSTMPAVSLMGKFVTDVATPQGEFPGTDTTQVP